MKYSCLKQINKMLVYKKPSSIFDLQTSLRKKRILCFRNSPLLRGDADR